MNTNTRIPSLSLLSLSLLLAACGGGGGGASSELSGNLACDPGQYRPSAPSGLGVAGLMDGAWRVVDQQLLPDARTRNPQLDEGFLSMDDQIEFRDGLKYDGEEPTEPGNAGGSSTPQPGFTATAEFFCNEQAGGLTLYGFGVSFSSPSLGSGATRVCGIFGTTSATEAIGVIVEEQVYQFSLLPAVDRFMVYQVTLSKVTSQPSLLEPDAEGCLADAETVAVDGAK